MNPACKETSLPPIQSYVSFRRWTTFGIGGEARYFAEAHSIEDLRALFAFCRTNRLPYLFLGKGSNFLMHDGVFPGLAILMKIDTCLHVGQGIWQAGAGYSFSLLGTRTAKEGWGGLEFAAGIPASVGGAIFMNAGANGQETQNCLLQVQYLTPDGVVQVLRKEDLRFGYRSSSFHSLPGAILGAQFQLQPDLHAREKQLAIIQYRQATQPYGERSAGCVFCNPIGQNAGALIEQAGLKGYAIGGASVSTLHANFLINHAQATCRDVQSLMLHVQQEVLRVHGVFLQPEIRQIQEC